MALVSDLFTAAEHWDTPSSRLRQDSKLSRLGKTTLGRPAMRTVPPSVESPYAPLWSGAFMLSGDASIYIGHSPSEYVPDVLQASPFDNNLIILAGNDLASVTPLVLHDRSTFRSANVHIL